MRGVLSDRAVQVVSVDWHGSSAITLTFTDESTGKPGQELLYRDDEPRLAVEQGGRTWSMDADGGLFRLVSEAKRISLAYLFDRFLAVQTSNPGPAATSDRGRVLEDAAPPAAPLPPRR